MKIPDAIQFVWIGYSRVGSGSVHQVAIPTVWTFGFVINFRATRWRRVFPSRFVTNPAVVVEFAKREGIVAFDMISNVWARWRFVTSLAAVVPFALREGEVAFDIISNVGAISWLRRGYTHALGLSSDCADVQNGQAQYLMQNQDFGRRNFGLNT